MDYNQITIEQMAATLAHEVKNPISLVMACIDLLEAEDPKASGKKSYRIMRRELSKVMDMMLDFIQLAKPMEVERKEIKLNELIDSILDSCKELYKNKIDFILNANDDYKIYGDEDKLKRVFLNIYKNAIEAMDSRGEVKTSLSTGDCGNICITIKDTGPGLSEEAKKKISTPFFTTKDNGSGLGVFICKNIINEHGGTFEIGNSEQRGCIVKINLPGN